MYVGETIDLVRRTNEQSDNLGLQKTGVDEVRWFDIGEVYEGCTHRDGTFCVPMEELELVMRYLKYAP